MTLDAQVLVVALLALLLGLIVECTKREVVETDNLQHWRNLSGRECGPFGVQQERVQAIPLDRSVQPNSMD
jgi:hypothetical protein